MKYKTLGRTGIDVGIIGLGAEHLEFAPRETVISVVNEALENGVNYIDLFMASPTIRDNMGIALKNRRHNTMIAGHLCSAFKNGQYFRTRDHGISEQFFHDLLNRLQTDYIDFLMLHYIDEPSDVEAAFGPQGLIELAQRLQREGKARYIGISSHSLIAALEAVNSGLIDVLMFPVNPAFDTLPGDMPYTVIREYNWHDRMKVARGEANIERSDLYRACGSKGVGIIGMKPYAAGRLFNPANPSSIVLTPVQCIHYALSQPAVCSVVPGCKTPDEMRAALAYLTATDEEKDFSSININTLWKLSHSCMYCNHCLPCPLGIDIGGVTKLADIAAYSLNEQIVAEYRTLNAKASDCIECGECIRRCPFEVDIMVNMKKAVEIFGD